MPAATLNIRMDANLKEAVDKVSKSIGLTPTAVFNVFARQFIAHRGFPFAVVEPVPNEVEFARQMDERYRLMRQGTVTEHDLIEA